MKKTAPEPRDLPGRVEQARSSGEAIAQLEALYRDVDQQLAAMGQTCRACGTCCDFDRFGHRLYLTTVELALLSAAPPPHRKSLAEGRCPYQDGSACAARQRRGLGCRVFSCDPDTDPAEADLYAHYHRLLGEIHATHSLAYSYVDIISALEQLPDRADPR